MMDYEKLNRLCEDPAELMAVQHLSEDMKHMANRMVTSQVISQRMRRVMAANMLVIMMDEMLGNMSLEESIKFHLMTSKIIIGPLSDMIQLHVDGIEMDQDEFIMMAEKANDELDVECMGAA